MALPFGTNLFPPRGEFLANFDFTDIATGLGFENFWGTKIIDTSGTTYHLLPNQLNPRNVSVSGTNTTQTGEGTTTLNFDSSVFNLPRTAKGTAYVTFSTLQTIASALSIKAQIAIVSEDLSVANISSEIESTQSTATGATRVIDLLALILTQKIIKKGEKLRLIIKIVIDASGGNGTLSHDNTNSDIDKHLKLLMPFRIVD